MPNQRILFLLSFALSALSPNCMAETKRPVRFMVLDTWSMPFAKIENVKGHPKLLDGAIKQWQEDLATEMSRSASLVFTSVKRRDAMIEAGDADILCLASPEWVKKGAYIWPSPYYQVEEKLVGKKGTKLIEKVDDLNGQVIGTIAEYHYPLLDKLFSKGAIQRENAPSEESAFRKQLYGRVHYTIMRSADFQYRQHIDRAAQELAISPLVITRTPVFCALSKKSPITLDEFSKAQERLLQKASFSEYLQRYF